MDQGLVNAIKSHFDGLFDGVIDTFRKLLWTKEKPPEKVDMTSRTLTGASAADQYMELPLTGMFGGPVPFVQVWADQSFNLVMRAGSKVRDKDEKNYPGPVLANVVVTFEDEDVYYLRITPLAYPCTVSWYASR